MFQAINQTYIVLLEGSKISIKLAEESESERFKLCATAVLSLALFFDHFFNYLGSNILFASWDALQAELSPRQKLEGILGMMNCEISDHGHVIDVIQEVYCLQQEILSRESARNHYVHPDITGPQQILIEGLMTPETELATLLLLPQVRHLVAESVSIAERVLNQYDPHHQEPYWSWTA